MHFQRAIAGAVKKKLAERRRELAEWHIGAHVGVRGQRGGQGRVIAQHFRRALAPGDNGAVVEGFVRVEDQVRIEIRLRAESLARGASAEMAVERKMLRGEPG